MVTVRDPLDRRFVIIIAGIASLAALVASIAFLIRVTQPSRPSDGAVIGNLRQLFEDSWIQQRPIFSPDGTKVALVVCNTLGAYMTGEVIVIDLKTRETTALRTNMGLSLVPDTSTRLNWIP